MFLWTINYSEGTRSSCSGGSAFHAVLGILMDFLEAILG
jgi:hypothetical protein